MEYDLSMSMVDKLINIDKINYIKKSEINPLNH